MLRSVRVSRDILSASNSPVRRRSVFGPEAEQRLKRGHRLAPTIVPKDELVQVDLQLRLTDPMVRADQPLLEVCRWHGPRAAQRTRRLCAGRSGEVAYVERA